MRYATIAAAAIAWLMVAPAQGSWRGWTQTDEMEGTTRKGMNSPWTSPKRAMTFPYQGTRAVLGVSCEGSGAYMSFTDTVNLSGDETKSGYNAIRLRVKVDDQKPVRHRATQGWGSRQLHFESPAMRRAILAGRSILIEVPWYGQGATLWRFSLSGTSELYRSQCPERAQAEAALRGKEARAKRLIQEAGWRCEDEAKKVGSLASVYKCVKKGKRITSCWYYVNLEQATVEPMNDGSREWCKQREG